MPLRRPSDAAGTLPDMAYDVELADRLRAVVADEPGLSERRMFGGLAFLVHGNLAVSASGQGGLLVRADPSRTEELLREPGARPFEMRGRAMRGWLGVDADAVATDDQLTRWAEVGLGYARGLPSKPPGAKADAGDGG